VLKPFLSAREAAKVLRVGDRTLRLMIRRGEIKALRAREGGRAKYYIPRAEVLRLLGTLDQGDDSENPAGGGA